MTQITNSNNNPQLNRSLTNRHIQLIAIGGAIGTGLFLGSGKTINVAGPSIVLVYTIIGTILFFVMRAMGELLLSNLQYKTFSDFAADLLGDWAGFFVGWTYWFCWVIIGIADVVAISGYLSYWFTEIALWQTSLACVILLTALNLTTVKMFGEIEFWFAMIKIIAIVALIIIGFSLVIYGYQTPSGISANIANLWNYGGIFPNGLTGFLAGFQIAIFSFAGIELVGTTAAETVNPEKNLAKAINSIPIRIVIFYVLALIVIMAVTPWVEVVPHISPFVHMFNLIGLITAAGFINFVVTTSAASSANSGIFSTSRMLFSLSHKGLAPKIFGKLSNRKIPVYGLLFTFICLLFGILLNLISDDFVHLFTILTTITAVLFMFLWIIFLASYLVYRKKHPQLHQQSKFKMPGGIIMSWISLLFFIFILVILTFEDDTRFALELTPIWFLILTIAWYKMGKKNLIDSKQ